MQEREVVASTVIISGTPHGHSVSDEMTFDFATDHFRGCAGGLLVTSSSANYKGVV